MTSTFAEIETLYWEKLSPAIGKIKFAIFSLDITVKVSLAIAIVVLFVFCTNSQNPLVVSGTSTIFTIISTSLTASLPQLLCGIAVSLIVFCVDFSWVYQRYLPFCFWDKYIESDYQHGIIPPLLRKINPAIIFTGEGQFPRKIITDSGLFPTIDWHDYFSSFTLKEKQENGLVLGQVSTHRILPEVSLRQLHHPATFSGLMARMPFPASWGYELYLLADFSEHAAAGMLKHNQAHRVLMDNPTFENYFHVYETDAIRAHYLLNTKVLESLAEFRHKVGHPVSIALKNGYCYLALHHYPSPFVPRQSLTQALTVKGIYMQYLQLEKLFSALDFLKNLDN